MKRLLGLVAACLLVAACGSSTPTAYTGSVHPSGWGKPVNITERLSPAALPTAVMYDTITLSTIPAHPFALAGYTSGNWPTYLPLRRAYPTAHTVSIAVNASHYADCLDVEPGDASPSQVPGWIIGDRAHGFKKPCVYSSLWEYVNQVRPVLAQHFVNRSSIFEWDADYTGVAHLDAGFDATQWTDRALGRNLDQSVVTLSFLSIATPPLTQPTPPVAQAACFGGKANPAAARCKSVLALYNKRVGAIYATGSALASAQYQLNLHNCKKPYRRSVCRQNGASARVLTARLAWFRAAVVKLVKANS